MGHEDRALRALLIDVEGTIVESEEMHRCAFNAAFREFGTPWHWDRAIYKDLLSVAGGLERLRHYVSRADPSSLERPDSDSFLKAMHKAKNLAYEELLRRDAVHIRPGVRRLLTQARQEGIRLAVVTSATRDTLNSLFKRAFGDETCQWFDVLADGDQVPDKKPAPDIYIWALEEMQVTATECLAFEDTPRGVKGAQSAGIPAVATVSSYTRDEDFSGAIAVIDHLGEPDQPTTVLSGHAYGYDYVTVDVLRRWHLES